METTKVEFRLTAATHVGHRRNHNEDSFSVNPDLTLREWIVPDAVSEPLALGKNGCAFMVADGMGGRNAGEVASALAVSEIARLFNEAPLDEIRQNDDHIERFLIDVACQADKAIRNQAIACPESKGMATTIILVWVIDKRAHLVWCGDSRAYIFNKDTGLVRFSKDHSYVQHLVDLGMLDESSAFNHPKSNLITRCLGDVPAEVNPEYKSYYLEAGDYILLCSDGLCGYCRDEEIEKILRLNDDDLYKCNQKLIEIALNAGGFDNITTALFQLVSCVTKTVEPNQAEAVKESQKEELEVANFQHKALEHFKTIASSNIKYFVLVLLSLVSIACFVLWMLN